MRISIIVRYIGLILLVNAAFMLLATIMALFNHNDSAFFPLLLSFFVTTTIGIFPLIFIPADSYVSLKEMYCIVTFSWISCCLFGMMPYLLWGGEFTFVNAWFESVSGYTTTGATILNNVEGLPKSLLLFRSSSHWIGGVGVVLFAMLIAPSMRMNKMRLSKVEISSLAQDNFKYKTQETIRIILTVYVAFTIICFFLLHFAGMDWFDALNHAFSTIATGGFSTKNLSIAAFGDNIWIQLIIIVFMFLSSLHFGLVYAAITGHPKALYRSPIARYYVFVVCAGIAIISVYMWLTNIYPSFGKALLDGAFQLVALTTTTGFATTNSALWPSFVILILMFFMLQGACAGSTVGGMKADRFFIFFKSLKSQLRKQQHPNAIIPVKVGKISIDDDVTQSVLLFMLFYLFIAFVTTIILTLFGIDVLSSFSASIASIGNTGAAFGLFGAQDNYSIMPAFCKILLTILMIIGRLEVYGFFILFFIRNWK